jgi:hypothetical protein
MPHPVPVEPLAKRILTTIQEKHLRPRPRWEFLFKNYFFWALGGLAVVLGALAFSAALFEIENAGWQYFAATHGSFISFFFAAAPFLWVAVLILFVLIGYVNIRHTRRGYRYPLSLIALGAVLTSITLGTSLYAAGLGGSVEESLGDHPPFYRPVLTAEHSWWLAPAKGLLGGVVVSVASDTASFTLQDFSGREWTIDSSDLRGPDLAALLRGGVVRVAGVPVAPGSTALFHACFVFPWRTFGGPSAALPLPLAFIASTSEKITGAMRSEECEGTSLYNELHSIDRAGH